MYAAPRDWRRTGRRGREAVDVKGILAMFGRLPKAALGGLGAGVVGTGVFAATMLGGSDASATLQVLAGTVEVSAGDNAQFRAARDGEVLKPIAAVRTAADGRAELKYFDGSLTRLDHETTFKLKELSGQLGSGGSRTIQADQTAGRTFNRVVKLTGSKARVDVKTPNATASVRGTEYVVEVLPDGREVLKVFSGSVLYTTTSGEEVLVEAGYKVEISASGEIGPVLELTPEDIDEWKQYNDCLDAQAGNPNITSCDDDADSEEQVDLVQAEPTPTAATTSTSRTQAFAAQPAATTAPFVQTTPDVTEPDPTFEPDPTVEPTPEPLVPEPTEEPQSVQTPEPTAEPTEEPTVEPTVEPTPTIAPTPTIEPPPPSPGSVSGVVRDAVDGGPIPGATVLADDGSSSIADENGSFVFVLDEGTYSLTASAPNYESQTHTPVVVTTEQDTPVDFDLNPEPGTIRGTVTDDTDGTPIEAATIELDGQTTTTAADGTYLFESVSASRTHDVRASKDEYVANNYAVDVEPGGAHVLDITLRLADDIAGFVRDEASGVPVMGATVSVEGTSQQATTPEDGSYAIRGLSPSETPYTVTVSHPNYVSESAEATVVPIETTTLNFELEKTPGRIFGKVTDARTGSQPIAGASVVLVDTDLTTVTDASGDYDFPRVAPGTYTVKATADGYLDRDNETSVTVAEDSGMEVNFSLHPGPGSISLAVNGPGGPLNANVALDGGAPISIGEDGAHLFPDVAAGDHGLQITHSDHETVNDSVAVGPGEDVSKTYAMSVKPGRVTVTVNDAAGHGIAGAVVTLDDTSKSTTSESATVTFEDVPAGEGHALAISHDDYEPATDSIDVPPGQTVAKTYTLAAKPGTITVNVTGLGGGPLNADVTLDDGTPQSTGEDGSIAFTAVPAGAHTVSVAHADYETEPASTFTLAPNGSHTVDFALDAKPGSITVTVSGFRGAALDAEVSLDGADPVAIGADGTHTFAVEAGTHTVSAAHADYETTGARSVDVGPNESATESFELTPKSGRIHGVVRDADTDAPIDGASVSLSDGTPVSATNGLFAFEALAPGDYTVRASAAPTHIANNVAVLVGPNSDNELIVELNPAPGSVTGTVRDDATEAPIEGATVSLLSTSFTTTTDAGGEYSLTEVPPGSYTLRVMATDYVGGDTPVTVSPGAETVENVGLTRRTGRIAGTVKDARTGDAVGGALVELGSRQFTTEADGAYFFESVVAGDHAVRGSADHYRTNNVSVAVVAGGNHEVNIELGGHLRIKLTWNAQPSDLDAHYWRSSAYKYHVEYRRMGSLNECPFAALDSDVQDGFGPEWITVTQPVGGPETYAVHRFAGNVENRLVDSAAIVQVFDATNLIGSFNVPTTGNTQKWWHVFDVEFDAEATTWVLETVNTLETSAPAPYTADVGACGTAP